MATGGSDISGGHDEIFEWNCNQCAEADKFVEAVVFCQECSECFCEPCQRNHDRFPALKKHTVIGKGQQENWGATKKSRESDECQVHDDQTLSMFCGNHDVFCCPVCASLEHRTCEDLLYIPQAAKGISDSRELRDTVSEVSETVFFLNKIKSKKLNCRAEIVDYKCSVLNSIEEQRRKANEAFDQLKAKAETEMAEVYEPKLKKLNEEIEICENVVTNFQSVKELLVVREGLSEKQLFLNLKSCQTKLRKWKNNLPADITKMPSRQKLEISVNPELQKAVDILQACLNKMTCTKINSYEYAVKKKYHVKVKTEEDEESCLILDLCVMSNGNLLLSDHRNRKLKMLNSSLEVVDYCNLLASPRGVCCINQDEAVVVTDNMSLTFISTRGKLEVMKSVELSHSCFGVACHGERLYVSDGAKSVYVYCMACMPLASLDMYLNSFQCFVQARFIAIGEDGAKLHVSDDSKGLVTIDSDGNHLSTWTHPDLQNARGVCLDGRGSVLVSGKKSHNVFQLNSQGDSLIGTLATYKDGLNTPVSIKAYKSSLVVTNGSATGSDLLTVIDLQLQ